MPAQVKTKRPSGWYGLSWYYLPLFAAVGLLSCVLAPIFRSIIADGSATIQPIAKLLTSSDTGVTCTIVAIPTLSEYLPLHLYRDARICHPTVSKGNSRSFPLHVLAHGDLSGGPVVAVYYGLQEQIASYGFVVALHRSCAFSPLECDGGKASFLEPLKVLEYVESNRNVAPIDFSTPFSMSGHSTGARAAMMIAALRDTPEYLSGTKYAGLITPAMRAAVARVSVVVADCLDPMDDPDQNPDVANYSVTRTPVIIFTGTNDWIEPELSGWKNFLMLRTPTKMFVDIKGFSHLTPIGSHPEGPFIAYASQYFASGNETARDFLYGQGIGSLRHELPLASLGDHNTGNGSVGFLACVHNNSGAFADPGEHASFCHFPLLHLEKEARAMAYV